MKQIILTVEQKRAIAILDTDVDEYLQRALNTLVRRAKRKVVKTKTLAEIESLE